MQQSAAALLSRCSASVFLDGVHAPGGGGVKKNTGARTKSRSKNMFFSFLLSPLLRGET